MNFKETHESSLDKVDTVNRNKLNTFGIHSEFGYLNLNKMSNFHKE